MAGCQAAGARLLLEVDAERALLGWDGLLRVLPGMLLSAERASLGTTGASRIGPLLPPPPPSCWLAALTAPGGREEVRGRPRGVAAPLLPSDEQRLAGWDASRGAGRMPVASQRERMGAIQRSGMHVAE